jgi:hypothetical protein
MATFLTLWAGSVFNVHPKCQDPLKQEGKTLAWCDALSVSIGVIDISLVILLGSCFVWLKAKGKRKRVGHDGQEKATVVRRGTLWNAVRHQLNWVTSRVLSEEHRQARTRSRTFDSSDRRNQLSPNPLEISTVASAIQMVELGDGGARVEDES